LCISSEVSPKSDLIEMIAYSILKVLSLLSTLLDVPFDHSIHNFELIFLGTDDLNSKKWRGVLRRRKTIL
jgi:hypothetical protein